MISVTKKEIKDCLLGKYKAEKENDILAACFSDDKNAEIYEIVREDLIESYLRGILSDEEKNLFKGNFLKDSYNRELLGFAKTLRGQLSENKQFAEIASAKPEKKPFAIGNFLVPVGGLAVLAIVSFLVWQMFLKKGGNEIVQASPTPTPPTAQISPSPTISPTPTISPNQTEKFITLNNSNSSNRFANATPAINTVNENQNENSSQKEREFPQKSILAFGLPMGLKSGEEILKIHQNVGKVKIEIPSEMIKEFLSKTENKFPEYNIKILARSENKEKIFDSNFSFEQLPKELYIAADKFKDGNYQFVVTGLGADGSTKELKGIESRFQVKIIK